MPLYSQCSEIQSCQYCMQSNKTTWILNFEREIPTVSLIHAHSTMHTQSPPATTVVPDRSITPGVSATGAFGARGRFVRCAAVRAHGEGRRGLGASESDGSSPEHQAVRPQPRRPLLLPCDCRKREGGACSVILSLIAACTSIFLLVENIDRDHYGRVSKIRYKVA